MKASQWPFLTDGRDLRRLPNECLDTSANCHIATQPARTPIGVRALVAANACLTVHAGPLRQPPPLKQRCPVMTALPDIGPIAFWQPINASASNAMEGGAFGEGLASPHRSQPQGAITHFTCKRRPRQQATRHGLSTEVDPVRAAFHCPEIEENAAREKIRNKGQHYSPKCPPISRRA